MNCQGKTHIGLVREINQDAYEIHPLPDGGMLAVVCDGMGGPAGGEVASTMSVELISKDIVSGYTTFLSEDELLELVRDAIGEANARVFEYSMRDLELAGMGTTVVLALATEQTAYLANVGDSRAYLYSCHNGQHKLTQITHDHSVVQELVDGGSLSSEEARNHPKKNIITRALGTQSSVNIDYFKVALVPGDKLLLCSDGLSNMLEEQQICALLQKPDAARAVDALIEASLDAGANDNVTAVLISR